MKFESKFNIGQEVFYLEEYKEYIKSGVVQSILVEVNKDGEFVYQYNMGDEYYVPEEDICATKTLRDAEIIFGLKNPFGITF